MASSGSDAPLISVLLPTRGRPAMTRAFLDSLAETVSDGRRLEVILYIDEDDPASTGIDHPRLKVTTVVGRGRVTMGAANTACFSRASGKILVLANDDVVVRTPGWDACMRACDARFADGIYLAWPDDRFASARMSTFPVLSRRCCEVLIEPYPLAYRSAFIDYALFDIFTRLRRLGHDRLVYLDQVVFDHHHHRSGKRTADQTTRRHRRFEDDMTFLARVAVRQRQAERLEAAIEARPIPPPCAPPPVVTPANGVQALGRFGRVFLGDAGLPWTRRVYLFLWYCGRYAAARWARR